MVVGEDTVDVSLVGSWRVVGEALLMRSRSSFILVSRSWLSVDSTSLSLRGDACQTSSALGPIKVVPSAPELIGVTILFWSMCVTVMAVVESPLWSAAVSLRRPPGV